MKKNDLKKKNKKTNKKDIKVSANSEYSKVLKVSLVVLLVFAAFYGITVLILNHKDEKKEKKEEISIQYEEILAGSAFDMNAKNYNVVLYDKTSEDANEIASAIAHYESKENARKVYTVDLSNKLNQNVVSKNDKANKEPKDASELSIVAPTILKFRDGELKEYIHRTERVLEYLNR